MVVRKFIYPLLGGLAFLLWVLFTLLLWFVGSLMSVDEEWKGWGDVLLNPYMMAPWLLLAAAFVTFALLHLRWKSR